MYLTIALRQLDRLLKQDILHHILNTEHILQQLHPVHMAVLLLTAALPPAVYKLPRRFSLLCICHIKTLIQKHGAEAP